jgi:hypothetical protein
MTGSGAGHIWNYELFGRQLSWAGHGFTGNGSNKYAQETLTAALEFFTKHLTKQTARP